MSEILQVFEPGERLATMTATGEVRVWVVSGDGLLDRLEPRDAATT